MVFCIFFYHKYYTVLDRVLSEQSTMGLKYPKRYTVFQSRIAALLIPLWIPSLFKLLDEPMGLGVLNLGSFPGTEDSSYASDQGQGQGNQSYNLIRCR